MPTVGCTGGRVNCICPGSLIRLTREAHTTPTQGTFHVQVPELPEDQSLTAKDIPRRGQSLKCDRIQVPLCSGIRMIQRPSNKASPRLALFLSQ